MHSDILLLEQWNKGTKVSAGLFTISTLSSSQPMPELLPLVFPKLWCLHYSRAVRQDWNPDNLDQTWTLQILINALKALVHQKSVSLKLCFLIDGLDEFEGDHEQIGKLFQEITGGLDNNTKACLSSRPWVVLEHLFNESPMLRLQNLTHHDITHHVSDKFERNNEYRQLAHREPDMARNLVHEVIYKADGVFLWVKLVVSSLLNGIRNRDEMSDLWERLRLLPGELKPLYVRLLELIEPIYLPWVSKAFQIIRATEIISSCPLKNLP
jgi:hypothetical protein